MNRKRLRLLLPILAVVIIAAAGCNKSRIDILKDKVKKSPDSVAAHNDLAYALSEIGKYEEALAEYNKSLELRPGDFLASMNKGKVLFDMQRFEESLEVFLPLVEANSDRSDLFSNIAMCYHNMKKYPEAMKYYRRSLELSKTNQPAKDGFNLLLQDLKAAGIDPNSLMGGQPAPQQPEGTEQPAPSK